MSSLLRRSVRIIVVIALISALLVGNTAVATSSSRYFLVADDVSSSGMVQVNAIRSNLNSLGYTNTYSFLPTASAIYSSLPNSQISVIHGHGSPGTIHCTKKGASTELLLSHGTSSQIALSNYGSGALNNVQLILFISCNSGLGPTGTTANSFTFIAFMRGASCTIGFRNWVAGGEWWGNQFTMALSSSTVAGAMSTADFEFNLLHPSISGTANAPSNTSNRIALGQINNFVWDL